MSLTGFDAMGVLTGPAVRAGGGVFALRYVGIPGNPKCIQRAEVDSLLGSGIELGFVFESWAARATEGFDAGRQDATAVALYMENLGLVFVPSVFYAVDSDVSFAQVEPYFRGVNSIRKGGIYGSARVVAGCLDNDLVTDAWQTVAWSHNVIEPRASVYQTGEQRTLSNGTRVDVNTASGYGTWAYPMGDDVSWTEKLTNNDSAYGPAETYAAGDWLTYTNRKVDQLKEQVQQLLDRPAAGTVQLSLDDRDAIIQGVAEELRQDLLNGLQAALNAGKGGN